MKPTPPLWKHQEEAISLATSQSATLFHMGMGTGKSRCAIEVALRTKAKRVLVLCPLSVCEGWKGQFNTFAPNYRVTVLNKKTVSVKAATAQRDDRIATAQLAPWVCVVNYESARSKPLSDWLMLRRFDLVVIDECHRIKSPAGATSRWVSRLAQTCKRRLGLTGTPMPHSPLDIYAQFRSLDPGVFGWSFVKFRNRYAKMGGFGGKQVVGYQRMDDLRERMSRLTYQADRSVLDLPPAIHNHRFVELSASAKRLYDQLDSDFVAQVEGGEITASNALVKLLRLQQLTSGMATVEQGEESKLVQVDDAKLKDLRDLFEDLPPSEPVVVFGRFTSDLLTVHKAARLTDRRSLELSGRRRELEEWQAGAAPVLAVQIQSGGTGIDLTRAAYCVYLSTGFSLGDYEQSLARTHRPGQDRTVFYYHLIAKDTIDQKVYHALRERKQVVEAVLDGITPRN